jgi:hypothetical protein
MLERGDDGVGAIPFGKFCSFFDKSDSFYQILLPSPVGRGAGGEGGGCLGAVRTRVAGSQPRALRRSWLPQRQASSRVALPPRRSRGLEGGYAFGVEDAAHAGRLS